MSHARGRALRWTLRALGVGASLLAWGCGPSGTYPYFEDMDPDMPARPDLPKDARPDLTDADMSTPADQRCLGVTCSQKGRCILVNDQPSCRCDLGFVPQALDCVAAPERPTLILNAVGDAQTTEAGGQATLLLQLSARPDAAVIVPLRVSAPTLATLSAPELVIQPEAWATPTPITLTGVDDGEPGGDVTYTLELGPTQSQDAAFEGLTGQLTLTSKDAVCGDGAKNGQEDCDPPAAQTSCAYGQPSCMVCSAFCKLMEGQPVGYCGDGVQQPEHGEQCDGATLPSSASCPAGTLGQPTCDASCKLDTSPCVEAEGRLAAGGSHTCAITPQGGVKCWGRNNSGQLGDGSTTSSSTPVQVTGLTSGVKALAAGDSHTCALLQTGAVKCWGRNGSGQLGNGSTSPSYIPSDVIGLSQVSALTSSVSHTCALELGVAKCWGANTSGQLGDGSVMNQPIPATVMGLNAVSAITAGSLHSCAVLGTGDVRCWGNNTSGRLGDGTTMSSSTPVAVQGFNRNAVKIKAGNAHTCVVTNRGGVKCWGASNKGQLGDGSLPGSRDPVDVSGATSGIATIAAGSLHTCALTTTTGLKCWGDNAQGQLGDMSKIQRNIPVTLSGFRNIATIATGNAHTCAQLFSGELRCWGDNTHGQLGDGTTMERLQPTAVSSFP